MDDWHGQAPQLCIGPSIVAWFELEYSGMREPPPSRSVFGKSEPYCCQRVRVWSTVGRRDAYGVAMRVLSAHDVVDLKRSVIGRLRYPAIFTAAMCPLPDQPGECRIHGQCYEMVRALSLTPSVRRALDLRMDITVAAVPNACISFFSSAVSSSC